MNNSKRQYEQHINTNKYNKITFYTLSNDILLRKTTYTYGALTGKSSYEINGEAIKEYLENLFVLSNGFTPIYDYNKIKSKCSEILRERINSFRPTKELFLKVILANGFSDYNDQLKLELYETIKNIYNNYRPDFYTIANECKTIDYDSNYEKLFNISKQIFTELKEFVSEEIIKLEKENFKTNDKIVKKLIDMKEILDKYLNYSNEEFYNEFFRDKQLNLDTTIMKSIENSLLHEYFKVTNLIKDASYTFAISELFHAIPPEYLNENLYSEYNPFYENTSTPFILDFIKICDKYCVKEDKTKYTKEEIIEYLINKCQRFSVRQQEVLDEYINNIKNPEEDYYDDIKKLAKFYL